MFISARDPKAPFEILRIYLEAGGNVEKCVMSHLDRKSIKNKIQIDKIETDL